MTDFSEFELWWKYLGKHKCSRKNKWCGKVTYYMFKLLDLVNFFDLDTKFTQRFSMFCFSKQAAEVSGRMKSNLWNQDVCKQRNICCLEFNSHWIYYISTVTTLKLCGWHIHAPRKWKCLWSNYVSEITQTKSQRKVESVNAAVNSHPDPLRDTRRVNRKHRSKWSGILFRV